MKSLFKVTLLAATMAVALNAPLTFAADTATKAAPAAESKSAFKNDDQKSAYALGASLGRYMENSLKEQEKLGIKLDKALLWSSFFGHADQMVGLCTGGQLGGRAG
ncbi:hypothetical protein L6P49_16375, partial [Klebsiella pneumoniae]|nr:hypothetical protein [Klebsiella pneumoniae]